MKITINSQTTGKFEIRLLNGREHIVTKMVPIVCNSIMNGGLYLKEELKKSYKQLHFLPAPNGHPKVNNQLVSAFHPLAMNANNFGGMVRNPKIVGDNVINEFWLDKTIAKQSGDGRELISRIEKGQKVGVSTGLNARKEIKVGNSETNKPYCWIARDIKFDHVAILLNEKPAGGDATSLANEQNIMIANCTIPDDFEIPVIDNALTDHQINSELREEIKESFPNSYIYIVATFPTENEVVFEVDTQNELTMYKQTYVVDQSDDLSLVDDRIEVVKKVMFIPVSGDANLNNNSQKEKISMGKKADKDVVITNTDDNVLTVENAVKLLESKGLVVNKKGDESDSELQYFIQNKDSITAMIKEHETELKSLRTNLVANSKLTEEDVAGMGKDMLEKLSNSIKPAQDFSLKSGSRPKLVDVSNEQDIPDDAYEESYTALSTEGVK